MSEDLMERIAAPGGLTVQFQPILEIAGDGRRRLHMLEALTRGPAGTNMASASVLFEYVRRKGREALVDRLCARACLQAASGLPGEPAISLNLHASTLAGDDFAEVLGKECEGAGVQPSRLVVEIVEHAPAYGGPGFLKGLTRVRDLGVRLALDDIGLGQSNFRMILESSPDYLKVDAHLVQGCHEDSRKQAILEALARMARRLGARVVAEGVESTADYEALGPLDIDLLQGFLFARPMLPADAAVFSATAES